MLLERALEVGVTIKFLARIVSIQDLQDHVALQLDDGSRFESDILIGADGKSPINREAGVACLLRRKPFTDPRYRNQLASPPDFLARRCTSSDSLHGHASRYT